MTVTKGNAVFIEEPYTEHGRPYWCKVVRGLNAEAYCSNHRCLCWTSYKNHEPFEVSLEVGERNINTRPNAKGSRDKQFWTRGIRCLFSGLHVKVLPMWITFSP
jgi:hypothetical protein